MVNLTRIYTRTGDAGTTRLGDNSETTKTDPRLEAYADLGRHTERFIGFELGTMFAPFGKIYSLEFYRQWITIPQCLGAKHSSLDRQLEWQRLAVRDQVLPEVVRVLRRGRHVGIKGLVEDEHPHLRLGFTGSGGREQSDTNGRKSFVKALV